MKKYKILVIPPFFPFPPTDGGKICIFGFIDYLRKDHEFHLFVPIRTDKERILLGELRAIWNDVTIHVVDEAPVKSKMKRLVKRLPLTKLSEWFRKINSKMDKENNKNPYFFYRNILNTFPFAPFGHQYILQLTKVFASHQFDIIQSELTPMLNLVHVFPRDAKKIFVQIESKEDVLKDYGRNNGINKSYAEYITSNTGFIEYSYMSLYDAVFTLNENDKRIIQAKCPAIRVFNSPFAILDNQLANESVDVYQPLHLLFMGGENHFPNYDGLKWFLTDVIPQFKIKLPLLYVTGSWRESTKNEFLKYYSHIEFTGFVDNLESYLANSVSIVPIRIGGGGMRTKVLLAMANNSPVVTTSVASAGIAGTEGVEFLLADTAQGFADKISDVVLNPSVGKRIAQNAHQLVRSTYSQKVMSERRNECYVRIMED